MAKSKKGTHKSRMKPVREVVDSVTSPVRDPIGDDIPPDEFPLKENDVTETAKNYQSEEKEVIAGVYESITAFTDKNQPDPRKELARAYKGRNKDEENIS